MAEEDGEFRRHHLIGELLRNALLAPLSTSARERGLADASLLRRGHFLPRTRGLNGSARISDVHSSSGSRFNSSESF
ncbi:hypothetical protein [Plantactinospora endophytica]|uniref:hypothetical protein n=1 Tax=Plantactinospora endophytica TaxID=673535 RepID=UPI001940653D|nr:hypothetical protein [Plantactinospora endophytica]